MVMIINPKAYMIADLGLVDVEACIPIPTYRIQSQLFTKDLGGE